MQWFLVRRVAQSFLVLFIVVTAVFILQRVVGDPLETFLPPDVTRDDYERLRKAYGFDRPLYEQYFDYLGDLARGDLGESVVRVGRKVSDLVVDPLWNSTKLAIVAWLAAMGMALPLGIVAALNRGRWIDTATRWFAVFNIVTPGWWVGIMLVILFAVYLKMLPAAGMGGWKHYILPAICLGSGASAGLSRLIRTTMLDVLDSEYIKMATAKGLLHRTVIWKHALRNAMIPIVTFGGLYFAALVTGVLTIEVVFAWPGLGRLVFDSIAAQDQVTTQSVVLITSAIVVFANLLVDIAYGVIDPRIRFK